ncbi:penicillin acylase family protein [Azospirillum sp.]|uniref:penicillin acylase family protein n=1 Tax=Azospirillum sp. TaxID=34012 RepID=UPI003D703A34
MRRFLKIVAAVVLAVVVLPALVGGGLFLWLRGEQPQHAGSLSLPGLERPVEVLRDADAVPHIFAETEADAYYALGFVHAQDRLWQMEGMRRLGSGRLAELFGTRFGDWTLRLDRLTRTLGFHRRAQESYALLSPEAKRVLDAYAKGVNAYIATRKEALPIEFQLTRLEPEPWKPADSLVWGKLMALQLAGNYREELTRARLAQTLTPQQIRDLYPGDPPGSPVTLAADLRGMRFDKAEAALPPALGFDLASNEWVLAGSRTATAKPILANDPHLGLEAPVLWYLARIVTPNFSITGATAPGMPLHALGQNGNVAWGFTNTHSDVQDLFVERVDPRDPTHYLTPKGSEPFTTRTEIIKVAGQPDEVLTVRETRHGPVLSGLEGMDGAPEGHVLALAWAGLREPDTSAEALYRLNHARTAAEVRTALAKHVTPQQNVVYADTAGTIGFIVPGLAPVRRKGDGTLPVPGWDGEYDWTGFIPFEALPQSVNPPSGQIVNANNAVVGAGYPYLLAANWPEPLRAARIQQMLAGGAFTVDDVAAQQLDVTSLAAKELLPLMTAAPAEGRAAEAVALLKAWDGRMDRDRPEPLIFEAWFRALNRALLGDELGPLYGEYFWQQTRTVMLALTDRPAWCDDVRTGDRTETCAEVLTASLNAALDELARKHGPVLATWRWGAEHVAPLPHPLLSRLPLVGRWFTLAVETDGDSFTVNRGTTRFSDPAAPYAHVHGAGFRAVYDLSDLGNSRYVIATGQSGNPLSAHWGDFVERWRQGESVRLTGDREALRKAGAQVLSLKPSFGGR